jgi:hypothetical protein
MTLQPQSPHASRDSGPCGLEGAIARVALLLGALGCVILAACGDAGSGPVRQAPPRPVAPPAAARPDMQRLVGSWVRPDGGYVLEVRSVAPDGTVDAAYFNPRPIHVSIASADWFDGSAHLFVEFDDVNYRGSTYQLDYLPDRDVLHGSYFQAEVEQTYEVTFVRRP